MNSDIKLQNYLPMSETAFYILLALKQTTHGYGIILHVQKMTKGRLQIGAGTIYGTLTRFEKDGIIRAIGEEERRKMYQLTSLGDQLLKMEINRLEELYKNGKVNGEVAHEKA
jgi:DNA-binding PadR family transcriptional regulator